MFRLTKLYIVVVTALAAALAVLQLVGVAHSKFSVREQFAGA